MKLTVRCPAKVNLFLAVGPPDERGWHPLRTIFQAISLADELTVQTSAVDQVISSWHDLPVENTLTRTITELRKHIYFPRIKVTLKKQIPAQSGLGGGSSDAAGLLRAIDHMLQGALDPTLARKVALKVGADVPFFLVGGRAKAEGYGEQLTPLDDAEPRHLVVVQPDEGVSTVEAYRRLDSAEREWQEFPTADCLYNDFERVAPCVCGELAERLQIHGADDALLSGSGSAVFGRFPSEKKAQAAAEKMKAEGWSKVWTCRTLSREESLWMS